MSAEYKKWDVPPKGSKEDKELIDLLKAFSSTLRKIPLYPPAHPMVKDSIGDLFTCINNFSQMFGYLNLDVFEDNIMICEKPVESVQNAAKDLTADFKKLRIEGVKFTAGITVSELGDFLRILSLKPDVIQEKGGVKQVLTEGNIIHITLNEVKFARIKDEEEVRKKAQELIPDTGAPAKGKKDIVSMVSDFLSGNSEQILDKDVISFEFKKNSRRLVKQLLKLIGPEKAVDEVLRIIEERFSKAGFTKEEQEVFVEKVKEETIRLKQPKVNKKQLEKELGALKEKNEQLKEKIKDLDKTIEQAVQAATESLIQENKKIKTEKHRINSVLRHVAEGLVIIDKEGRVLLLNPAAEDLLGMHKEDKIGQHILEGLKEEQMVSLSKDKALGIEIELAGKNEETKKILRASNAVIENEDGETVGIVSVLSDITKQKDLERIKETFINNVTHDLRAPLISIQKSLSIFLEGVQDSLPKDQKQFLEIASNSAARLMNLVNDLLDVSKLESGRVSLEYSRASIGTVVETVMSMLGAWASSRGIILKKEISESIEFDFDQKLLNQVFTNLVGNAIKFTPSGGTISISAVYEDKNVKISVEDTGCGIPSDSLERIFEKFEQAKNIPAVGAPKGTGLGLAIVKDIVLLHGGKICAKIEPGKGSKFIFIIPKEKELLDVRD